MTSGTERVYDGSAFDRVRDIRLIEDLFVPPIPLPNPAPDAMATRTIHDQPPLAIATGMKLDVDKTAPALRA